MKILMPPPSHDQQGNTGRPTGFWLEEFAALYFALAAEVQHHVERERCSKLRFSTDRATCNAINRGRGGRVSNVETGNAAGASLALQPTESNPEKG